MSERQETVDDIIAEMRFHGQQNIDAEKDKPEYGILTAEGRITLSYADRLEAALKRELSKNASKNGADFGQLGDVAKLREALEFIAHYNDNEAQMDDPCCADGHILAGKAKEALGIKEKERGAK